MVLLVVGGAGREIMDSASDGAFCPSGEKNRLIYIFIIDIEAKYNFAFRKV